MFIVLNKNVTIGKFFNNSKTFLFSNVFFRKPVQELGWFKRSNIFFRAGKFLRANNLQFVIKKKFNLRKQKRFFYLVHIAAPRKKKKNIRFLR